MVPQVGHCPNFKLGQWLTWGTKGPTLKLPQFKIRAMVNLGHQDRKSTRLNSSHDQISYAVFCLKKKKKHLTIMTTKTLSYDTTGEIADAPNNSIPKQSIHPHRMVYYMVLMVVCTANQREITNLGY